MNKIFKKIAMAVAFIMCVSLSLPAMAQVGVYAGTVDREIRTIVKDVRIENFKSTGTIGVPYVVATPTNITNVAVSAIITKPDGTKENINLSNVETNSFVPQVAGKYKVTYAFVPDATTQTYYTDMYFTVENAKTATISLELADRYQEIIPAFVTPEKVGSTKDVEILIPTATVKDEKGNSLTGDVIVSVSGALADGTPLGSGTSTDENFVYNETNKTLSLQKVPAEQTIYKATYTITYTYNHNNVKATKEVVVVADLSYDSTKEYTITPIGDVNPSAQIGIETVLPTIEAKDEDGKEVSVFYTVSAKLNNATDCTENVITQNDEGKYILTPNQEGDYTITYNVKNKAGNAPKGTIYELVITGVEDNTAPNIVVTTPYAVADLTANKTPIDATSALVNATENNDILILPIYATDNANKHITDNLTLNRVISANSSNDKTVKYNENEKLKEYDGTHTNKVLVFNASDAKKIIMNDATQNGDTVVYQDVMINGVATDILKKDIILADTTLENGTSYTVKYTAEDKAKNTDEKAYDLKVMAIDSTVFDATTDKPTVTFETNTIPTYFKSTQETFEFTAPTGSFTHSSLKDSHVSTYVTYKTFDGTTWSEEKLISEASFIEFNKDTNKYTFTFDETALTGITQLEIIAHAVADFGDLGTNTKVATATKSKVINFLGTGADAQLITAEVNTASFYTISADYGQNKTIELPKVTYSDPDNLYNLFDINIIVTQGEKTFPINNMSTYRVNNTIVVENVKFFASESGEYSVSYIATDSNNNKNISVFNILVPVDPATLDAYFTNLPSSNSFGTIELGEAITLPDDIDVVCSNGLHVAGTDAGDTIISTDGDKNYRISLNKAWKYSEDGNSIIPTALGDYTLTISTKILDSSNNLWTTGKLTEGLLSKTYIFTVQDTKGPEFNAEEVKNTIKDLNKNGTTLDAKNDVYLPIPQGDYNRTESYAEITSAKSEAIKVYLSQAKLTADERISTNANYNAEQYFKLSNLYDNVVYSVFYNLVDENGVVIKSETFTFGVGDVVAPTIAIDDTILKANYKLAEVEGDDNSLEIDLSKIIITDNIDGTGVDKNILYKEDGKYKVADECTVNIYLKNDQGGSLTNKATSSNSNLKFAFNNLDVGNYTLVVTVTDSSGTSTTDETIKFTVTAPANDGLSSEEVLGVVLIVISVLMLGGVITYFVVTRKNYTKRIK